MTKKEELNEEKIMFGEIDLECELAGYNSTSSLIEHGVSFYQIKKLVEDGRLVKIERGLYASPDSFPGRTGSRYCSIATARGSSADTVRCTSSRCATSYRPNTT